MTTCKAVSCLSEATKGGLCSRHYYRQYTYGNADAPALAASPGEPLAYFNSTVVPYSDDDCLIWPYARNRKGYAIISRKDGGSSLVSRRACEVAHGAAPSSIYLAAHSCGNGHLGCVNPRHVYWGTPTDNRKDMLVHGTQRMGEGVTTSRLAEHEARAILNSNRSEKLRLAGRYGVSETTIRDIWARRTWRHLDRAALSNRGEHHD